MGPVKLIVWFTSLTLTSFVFVCLMHLLLRSLLRCNENQLKWQEILMQVYHADSSNRKVRKSMYFTLSTLTKCR